MTYSAPPLRIRWGFWAMCSALLLSAAVSLSLATNGVPSLPQGGQTMAATDGASPTLARTAAVHPRTQVEVIVQFRAGVEPGQARTLVHDAGGRVTGELHVINGLAAHMTAGAAAKLARDDRVRAASLNAAVKQQAVSSTTVNASNLVTSYPDSVQAPRAWSAGATGKGVGVAVIDTGIAGGLADFGTSASDSTSRVVTSAVTNPYARNEEDSYGHGTHVAGIIAGNSNNRASSSSLRGDYVGVAPEANLINVKVADEKGDATVLDVIYGLQFVVDNKNTYNIRVANLSLESTDAQSYRTDPLDAAAEAAWFSGIVVVAAAGNRGSSSDAVSYAPGNDPYVISVGGVDDQGTKNTLDDALAGWSSRGTTQDGYAKPEVLAPGAHIVSNLAPKSAFASMCSSCIIDKEYIRAGGTSMAAPMVAGAVADMLQTSPGLTPDQVKGTVVATARKVGGDQANEVSALALVAPSLSITTANQGLKPNNMIDASTGAIDYTRSSWSRSSWSRSSWSRSSWSRSSWSCNCSTTSTGSIDPTRSSWSRSSWSTSWTK